MTGNRLSFPRGDSDKIEQPTTTRQAIVQVWLDEPLAASGEMVVISLEQATTRDEDAFVAVPGASWLFDSMGASTPMYVTAVTFQQSFLRLRWDITLGTGAGAATAVTTRAVLTLD